MFNAQSIQREIAILFFFSALLSVTVAVIAVRRRNGITWRFFTYAMLCTSIWSISDAMFFLASPENIERWFWMMASYAAQVMCAPIIFSFALYFAGLDRWLTPWRKALLWSPFLLAAILTFTNPWHSLIWNAALPPTKFNGDAGYGIYFYFMLVVAYGLLFVAVTILLLSAWRVHTLYRWQAITVAIAVVLPFVASVLYFTPWNPIAGVDLAPLALVVSGLVLVFSTTRLHLVDMRPVFRDAAFDRRNEGAVILDAMGRIADVNPIAQQMLATAGWSVSDAGITALASIFALDDMVELTPGAFYQTQTREQPPRYFDLQVTEVESRPPILLLVWRDTTPLRLAQISLSAQEHSYAGPAPAEADTKPQIGDGVDVLRSQALAALNSLEQGEPSIAAALLIQMHSITAENLKQQTLTFYDPGIGSADFFVIVREYVAQFAEIHHLQADIELDPDLDADQLSSAARLQLVRILQEALENVRRHAQAQHIRVTIKGSTGWVTFTIRDDGIGFDPASVQPAPKPTGMDTMARRAKLASGHMSIAAAPGAGVVVTAVFPAAVTPAYRAELQGKRALIVVEQPLERDGVRNRLTHAGLVVVASDHAHNDLVETLLDFKPDMVLLDIEAPAVTTKAYLGQIHLNSPQASIVVLADEGDPNLPALFRSRIDGVLLKSLPVELFLSVLAQIAQGESGFAPLLSTQLVNEFRRQGDFPSPLELLTPRQSEIFNLIAQGLTYAQIADRLSMHNSTVRYHVDKILHTLELANRNELVIYARRHRLARFADPTTPDA